MDAQTFRESVTSAIKYWEPRRLVYNAVLAAVVLIYFAMSYPASRSTLTIDLSLLLFLMAVLANIAYCAAYPIDIFVCASSYGEPWRKYRWIVLVIGSLFAATIARFIVMGMFLSGASQAG